MATSGRTREYEKAISIQASDKVRRLAHDNAKLVGLSYSEFIRSAISDPLSMGLRVARELERQQKAAAVNN